MKMFPSFEFEDKYISLGYSLIAGVDEVGRGSLAGPLLACAVIFNIIQSKELSEIKDSKKLTPRKRRELAAIIKKTSLDYAIGRVEAEEIDSLGVGSANILAFERALNNLKKFDLALIDGRNINNFPYRHECIIKGDNKSISIAAASIVAKVERDEMMANLDEANIYGFDQHAGYGTAAHIAAIKRYGPSPHHRRSFLKNIWQEELF